MGKYTVIADVSSTLVNLFRDNMVPEPIPKPEQIGFCTPSERGDFALGLYIYDIKENGDYRPMTMRASGSDALIYPPMSLTLKLMVTAYSKGNIMSKVIDEQRVLGRAIQILNDNRKIEGKYLVGSIKEYKEELTINNIELEYDEKIRIWSIFNEPYKLSMYYEIGPIFLESTKVKEVTRVTDVDITIKKR